MSSYSCDLPRVSLEMLILYGHYKKALNCFYISYQLKSMVCPSDCSGRGVCDYCLEVPQCICDDPFDDSPGCWNSQGW